MIKRIGIIIAATAAALAAFTLLNNGGNAEESEETTEETTKQQTAEEAPKQETTQQSNKPTEGQANLITATGTVILHAQDIAEVTSLMSGVVKTVTVKQGDHVSKGQVVATVENTDVVGVQREYFTACQEAKSARIEMERQQMLADNGAGIRKNLQQAQTQYQIAQSTATGLARQLSQMGINTASVAKGQFTSVFPLHAPISGTVAKVNTAIGGYADMQTPIMEIQDNSDAECDLNVFEKDLSKIRIGQKVSITLPNQPSVTLTGKVYGINDSFNEGTKTIGVHVKITDTAGTKLINGMYVSGNILIGEKD